MLRELVKPQNGVKLLAGLSGIFFERILPAEPANESETAIDTAVVSASGSPAVRTAATDDLTVINGIGPTFARRLKDAGVDSYAKLAVLTPEDVKRIAQLTDWQADPAGWIAQARARSA